jgi:hypothetical protein
MMVRVYDDTSSDDKFAKYFKDGEITVVEQKGLADL